jgi:uncharacterized protein
MKKALFALLVFPCLPLLALEPPPLLSRVNDRAAILKAEEKTRLEAFLAGVEGKSSVQIAVLTLPSLQGDNLEDFSIRTAEKWGLGQKGKDNGVLLLVVMDERAIRIETGYGLEESLTDARCGAIIRNVMTPLFRQEKYGQGLIEGAETIAGFATGDENLVSKKVTQKVSAAQVIVPFMFIGFVLFLLIASGRRRYYGGIGRPCIGRPPLYPVGRPGGFSSGGGFHGGGGSFGGGGASGRW